jgi:hypothetical protein
LVPTKREISDGILAVFGTRESNDTVLGAILICSDVEDCLEPRGRVIPNQFWGIAFGWLKARKVTTIFGAVGIFGDLQRDPAEIFL